ncbi:MAG: thrC [Geobacteraceae bacterium]|nr:thrC [Geobacteraceae bacterium]
MKYISTRGNINPVSFKDAVMMGLATDGGLLLPERIPAIAKSTFDSWKNLSYLDLAFEVISPFADDIPPEDLKRLIKRSYSNFVHEEIVPVVKKNGVHILELFHGPTLAFKDVALQLLGNLFEYLDLRGTREGEHFHLHSPPPRQDFTGAGAADDHRT